jgi:hypothetical protein
MADPRYAGFQVVVPGMLPNSRCWSRVRPLLAKRRAADQVERVDGSESGSQTLTFQLPAARRFDFNGSANDTQPVINPPDPEPFWGVRGNTLYNDSRGFGWTQTVSEFQRASAR